MLKLFFIAMCLSSSVLFAHEDPHDVIQALTHRLEHAKEADKAELYFKRAVEYRVSGQMQKAEVDLYKYVKLMPDDYLGWFELGSLQIGAKEKLTYLCKAVALSDTDERKAKSNYAVSECLYSIRGYDQALGFCEMAIEFGGGKGLTPSLFKSHLLWRLGELEKRVSFLSDVKLLNKSVVLERAWIDAKIDAGQGNEVKAMILKEMEGSRFKSSWQIRAALCEGKGSDESKGYAELAIREIDERLNLERPDVTLLMDLVRAYSIVGDVERASYYMKLAKALRYDPWAMAELEEKIKVK